jgi:hypothetical protein
MGSYALVDTNAREVERMNADANERGGALSAVDAAPALAEGTAGIKPASGAKRATAAKPEALQHGAYGKTCRRCKMPWQGEAGRRV